MALEEKAFYFTSPVISLRKSAVCLALSGELFSLADDEKHGGGEMFSNIKLFDVARSAPVAFLS